MASKPLNALAAKKIPLSSVKCAKRKIEDFSPQLTTKRTLGFISSVVSFVTATLYQTWPPWLSNKLVQTQKRRKKRQNLAVSVLIRMVSSLSASRSSAKSKLTRSAWWRTWALVKLETLQRVVTKRAVKLTLKWAQSQKALKSYRVGTLISNCKITCRLRLQARFTMKWISHCLRGHNILRTSMDEMVCKSSWLHKALPASSKLSRPKAKPINYHRGVTYRREVDVWMWYAPTIATILFTAAKTKNLTASRCFSVSAALAGSMPSAKPCQARAILTSLTILNAQTASIGTKSTHTSSSQSSKLRRAVIS